jgi:hypothetical protein
MLSRLAKPRHQGSVCARPSCVLSSWYKLSFNSLGENTIDEGLSELLA